MGQRASVPLGNTIYIVLQRRVYFPGDEVSGVVVVDCEVPFRASSIEVKASGFELYSLYDPFNGHVIHQSAHSIFKSAAIKAYDFEQQTVQPGTFIFPFSFRLPENIPSCFNLHSHGGHRTVVRYHIKAVCRRPGRLTMALRHQEELVVFEHLREVVQPVLFVEEQPVSARGVISREGSSRGGSVRGGRHQESVQGRFSLNKSAFAAGETLVVRCELSNNSTTSFATIQCQLRRSVKLVTGYGVRSMDMCIRWKNSPGEIASGQELTGQHARRIHMTLPMLLPPQSIAGCLVRVTYYLRVKLLPAGTTLSRCHFDLPITIYAPQPGSAVAIDLFEIPEQAAAVTAEGDELGMHGSPSDVSLADGAAEESPGREWTVGIPFAAPFTGPVRLCSPWVVEEPVDGIPVV